MVLSITIGHPLFAHNNLPKFAKMAKIRQSPGFFLRYLAENVTKKHWFIQISIDNFEMDFGIKI